MSVPLVVNVSPWFALAPIGIATAIFALPILVRTRRVLRAGFGIGDLRNALHQHWTRRREELAYEQVETGRTARYALWGTAGAGWASLAAGLLMGGGAMLPTALSTLGGMFGTIFTILGISDAVKRRFFSGRAGSSVLRFWNGRWAERLVRLSRTGLTHVAIAPAAPQFTEIALGRATDALFQALPAPLKKDLAKLPQTVRTLENDAQTLRSQITQLDRSLADLGGDRGSAESAAGARERQRMIADLTATRDVARSRLAASVTALENIRLGLMRLQLGSAPVASVTTAILDAQRIAREIALAVEASVEVEAALKRR
jgi:hypothetical protein